MQHWTELTSELQQGYTITASGSVETLLVQTVRYSTLVETTSISAPPTPTTVSVPASTVTPDGTIDFRTSVLPAPTLFVTQDIPSSPPETATAPVETVTVPVETVTVPASTRVVTVPGDQETVTVLQPAQPTAASAPADTVTEPGSTSAESTTQALSTCAVILAPSATGAPIAAAYDPASDLTWGCAPGTNCDPPKPGLCEVWADSPADEFACQAAHCRPVRPPALGGGGGKFPLSEGYFVLDPARFGLGFDVFIKAADSPNTGSPSVPSTGAPGVRPRDLNGGVIPATCFGTCNNAYLEAQSLGKTPPLCRPESAFMSYLLACERCAAWNAEQTVAGAGAGAGYLPGKFSQFLLYCEVSSGDANAGPGAVGTTSAARAGPAEQATAGVFLERPSPAAVAERPSGGRPGPSFQGSVSGERTSAAEPETPSGQAAGPSHPGTASSAREGRTSAGTEERTQAGHTTKPNTAPSAAPERNPNPDGAGGPSFLDPVPGGAPASTPPKDPNSDSQAAAGYGQSPSVETSAWGGSRPKGSSVVVAGVSPAQWVQRVLAGWGAVVITVVFLFSYV